MAKPYVIGIDMGGTNTAFGIVDARGTVIASSSIKTGKHSKIEDYIDELYTEIHRIMVANDAEGKINGIGIGAPNGNYFTGMIEDVINLPWPTPIPLAQLISDKFGIPCLITNDANAAAIGEMTYGAARGLKDFIMIRCLEAYCSATGVARTAREFLEIRDEESLLRDYDIETITSKDVYDCAVKGDKLAIDIFNYTGTILGEALADFVTFSSPEAFVIFGGLTKSGDYIMNPIREAFDKNIMKVFKGKVKILISELKESDAAVLGASALGWEIKED